MTLHPLAIQAVILAATWDAWRWYGHRIAGAPEEAAAFALLVVVLIALAAPRLFRRAPDYAAPLLPVAALLTAYGVSQWFAPPIIRCALAAAAVLYPLYLAAFRERPPVAFWGIVALAMPLLTSLQFFLGYPMRVISASLTAAFLEMQGIALSVQGTFLVWRGEMVQFDAPCSGVNMLWGGLLITLAACLILRLGVVKTTAAIVLSIVMTTFANVLRTTSLFYIEAGVISGAQDWWHEGIGLVAFALAAATMLGIILHMQGRRIPWPG